MMITKFNKSKCLFKEIVKIPELCFEESERERKAEGKKVQFSAIFPLQFVLLLKFFTCMSIKSLFHYTRYRVWAPVYFVIYFAFRNRSHSHCCLLLTPHERLFFENFKLNNKLVFVQMLLQVCLLFFSFFFILRGASSWKQASKDE